MKHLDLEKIFETQRQFARDREWEQFHTPKNLAMALAGEAGELLELFQWLTPEQSFEIAQTSEKREELCDELADILYYLLRITDLLNIDINHALWAKIAKNAKKYPVELAKGSAKKYTELEA